MVSVSHSTTDKLSGMCKNKSFLRLVSQSDGSCKAIVDDTIGKTDKILATSPIQIVADFFTACSVYGKSLEFDMEEQSLRMS